LDVPVAENPLKNSGTIVICHVQAFVLLGFEPAARLAVTCFADDQINYFTNPVLG